jgi:type II secretory pathway pseudopilin PulG
MTSATGRKNSAFTLIELILVMGLALMVMAMAAPRLDGFTRGRVLRCQGDNVLSLLNTARDRAAAEAVAYRVEIAEASCTLERQQGGTFVPAGIGTMEKITLAQGITARLDRLDGQTAATWVQFQPSGECTPARITLTDGRGNTIYVALRSALEPPRVTEKLEETYP